MKRLLTLLLLAAGFTTGAWAQTAKLTRDGYLVKTFTGASSLSSAISAAASKGDIIVLSSGSFSNPGNITKSVSIYGQGFENSTAIGGARTYISGKLEYKLMSEGALDGIHLEGLFIENDLNILTGIGTTAVIDDFTVKKCHSGGVFFYQRSTNVKLQNCKFDRDVRTYPDSYTTTMQVDNCYIEGNLFNFADGSNIIVNNSLIHNNWYQNYSAATSFNNCIIYKDISNGSSATKCIFNQSSVNGSTDNCWMGVNNGDIYVAEGEDGSYSESKSFAVKDTYVGTDNTPVGLQGGIGWNKTPTIPSYLTPEDLPQDAEGYYLLDGKMAWLVFATHVETTPTANARMTADIDLGDDQTMIGTSSAKYQGTLDGQGHTLTINYTTTENYYAPFRYIQGAKIKNLHVAGTIHTSHRFTGGLVGVSYGTSNIESCRSSVELISSYSGDAVHSGFVASIGDGTLNIKDCLFDGILTGSSALTWGGFVGWKYSNTANINNCLFNPKSVNVGAQYSATFSGNGGTVKNCYYTVCLNNSSQGTQVTAAQLADGGTAYKLQAFRDQLIWGQRIDTDDKPVLTSDESCRVYRSKSGGYTNDPELGYPSSLEQDAEGYYLLRSLFDWQNFAMLVDATPTAKARMTADIDLGNDQTMIGTSNVPYQGTFDGQEHSLTVAYVETDASSEHVAPFIKIQGATIQNLHVKGSINTAGKKPAGIVSHINGTSYVKNCWSEVAITSSYNGEIGAGGLVSWVDHYAWIYMEDCLFCGSITLSNSGGYKAGGLIGWKEGYSNARLTNCLSAPENMSSIKSSSDNSVLISGANFTEGQKIIITNCYYVNVGSSTTWVAQGKKAESSQLADGSLAYKLQAFRDQLNWGQKLGTDAVPVPYTVDESRRVYRANSGGFTNTPAEGYLFHQDTDGYYIISSLLDWQDFAILVESTPNANAKMTADVNLGDDQTVIATTYSGTFDGQEHTLTVNLTATKEGYGPFCTLSNATIKNLHVTGTVTTAYNYTGGIVGASYRNTNTLTNCWSSITMRVTNTAGRNGGLVGGTNDYDTLNMIDCLFDGQFDGEQSSDWGGFLGLNYYSTVNISNSLFAPTSINIKGGLCPFFTTGYGGVTLTNCFTSVPGNTTQGLLVTAEQMTNGSVAYLLQKGRNDLIWTQEIRTDTHPRLWGDNSSRVYSAAGGGYTNDPAQAGSDLVFNFTIAAGNGDITINGFRSDFTPPADYALVIPDDIGGYPVRTIANNAFKQKSTIKSLSIGRNVQSIGNYSFSECTSIPSVVIPNSVISLGTYVFNGCTSLSSASFEDGCQLTQIPSYTFSGCSKLSSVNIPSTVTTIANDAFSNCGKLTAITIPATVTLIDGNAFNQCTSLNNVNIPGSVKTINSKAFYQCTNLTNLTIEEGLTTLAGDVFQYSGLTSVTLPSTMTSIGNNLFYRCNNLATLDLSKADQVGSLYGLTTINRNATGIFNGIPADCEVILPPYCQATGDHVTITEPGENPINIADDGYYELNTPDHWRTFCAIVAGKNNANARMTADIDLGISQYKIGLGNSSFKGIFDGQGHTLTVHYVPDPLNTNVCISPFPNINGATIKNIHITGTMVNSTGSQPAPIGNCTRNGTSTIENLWSSVIITDTKYDWDETSGIVGNVQQYAHLIMRDCIFTGSNTSSGDHNGCFVGHVDSYGSATITNCISLGEFHYTGAASNIVGTNTNCYVKQFPGTIPSEMRITDEQIANGAITYKLQASRADLVWGQRIGIDPEPMLTNDESYRVYKTNTGGYTNDPSQAYEGLKQDAADNYYLISSIADWQEYATLILTSPTANAKMTADINLGSDQTKIGSESTPYQGTFDGQGHSLTMAYVETDGSSQHAAPFIKIKDATIQNLHVKGYITTAGMRPAGITSYVTGTCYIKNCWSEVDISSSRSADICAGGLVTRIDAGQILNMSDCLFTGSITLSHSNGYAAGGLIGWTQENGTANVENCLFAPSGVSSKKSTTDNKTLVSGYQSKVYITNCYYNVSSTCNWTTQGTFATDEDLDNGTITDLLQAERDEQIWMQDAVSDLPQLAVFGSSSPSVKVPYAIWCEDNKTLYFDSANTRLRVGKTYDGHTITSVWSGDNVVETPQEAVPAWNDIVKGTCTHVVFKESFSEMRPTSLYYWFFEFLRLEDITGLEYLNTSEATTMRGMFLYCDALQAIDVSNFDTSKSTTFRSMFDHCVSLKALDVSSFKMKQGDNTQNMFYNCQELEVIYSSSEWYSKIGSGDNSYTMFYNCAKLKGETGYEYISGTTSYDGTYATFDFFFTRKPIFAGDVNGDGIVTITDAMLVVDSLSTGKPLEGTARQAADTNGDGEITYTDVVNILDMILAP